MHVQTAAAAAVVALLVCIVFWWFLLISHYWTMSLAMFIFLPEQENAVLQWIFKLNIALAATENAFKKAIYRRLGKLFCVISETEDSEMWHQIEWHIVTDVFEELTASVFKVLTTQSLKMEAAVPFEVSVTISNQLGITFQKTWIFICIAVRTSNRKFWYFLWPAVRATYAVSTIGRSDNNQTQMHGTLNGHIVSCIHKL